MTYLSLLQDNQRRRVNLSTVWRMTGYCNSRSSYHTLLSTHRNSPKSSSLHCDTDAESEMVRLRAKSDYEDLRNARILENKARLESLGLQKTVSELRSIVSSAKSEKNHVREYRKVVYGSTQVRRSNRIKELSSDSEPSKTVHLRRSLRFASEGKAGGYSEDDESFSREMKRPANAPLVKIKGPEILLLADASGRRCNNKGRGGVYDPTFGICCHYCRQKKLCGEEDCKRCSDLDTNEPCLGKTDCSACHSSTGVLCRACLKVRYGEEMEEVRENKEWMCPHCIEAKGINPYWICNSSLCLKKRNMAPTGLAIYQAREMGYKSVAHLLMDELQQGKRQGFIRV